MTFKIGDEVVCINTLSFREQKTNLPTGLMLGKIYAVRGVENSFCCGSLKLDVGIIIPPHIIGTRCICGVRSVPPTKCKLAIRFIKLDKSLDKYMENPCKEIYLREMPEFMKKPPFYLEEM